MRAKEFLAEGLDKKSTYNISYGSTNTQTWTPNRVDYIFIGIKI